MNSKGLSLLLLLVPATSFGQFYSLTSLNLASGPGVTVWNGANNGIGVGRTSNYINNVDKGDKGFYWTPTGGMQTIGTLGTDPSNGRSSSNAVAVSSSGVVFGQGVTYSGSTVTGYRAFTYDPVHGIQDIGDLGRNNSGYTEVTVSFTDGNKAYGYANKYNGNTLLGARPFVWDAATGMHEIGNLSLVPSGTAFPAAAKNGVVVGQIGRDFTHKSDEAFIYDDVNGYRKLGVLSPSTNGLLNSSVATIIDGNSVFGYSTTFAGNVSKGNRAFAWDPVNGMVNIGAPTTNLSGEGESRIFSAINGLAFCSARKWSGNTFLGTEAFTWDATHGITRITPMGIAANGFDDTTLTQLADGTAFGSSAYVVNGVYVATHAVLWDPVKGYTDLNTKFASIIPSGWTLSSVDRYADGWYYGTALVGGGRAAWAYRAVPEPTSLAAIGLGLVGFFARKRKK